MINSMARALFKSIRKAYLRLLEAEVKAMEAAAALSVSCRVSAGKLPVCTSKSAAVAVQIARSLSYSLCFM